MSAYENFVLDYPQRCIELIDITYETAKCEGREVTLILSITSAAFTVPYERLRPKNHYPTPTEDTTRFPEMAQALHEILEETFMDSDLGIDTKSWQSGNLRSLKGEPGNWSELQREQMMDKGKKVKNVLKVIRHALAHGTIFTYKDPIEAVVFVSTNYGSDLQTILNHEYIKVHPDCLRNFLKNWLKFLSDSKISHRIASNVLSAEQT